jgi:hypothetical protein
MGGMPLCNASLGTTTNFIDNLLRHHIQCHESDQSVQMFQWQLSMYHAYLVSIHTYVNILMFDKKGDNATRKTNKVTSMHEETKITKKR